MVFLPVGGGPHPWPSRVWALSGSPLSRAGLLSVAVGVFPWLNNRCHYAFRFNALPILVRE